MPDDQNLEHALFCIDASALIRIFRFYPKDLIMPIWKKLEDLFKKGQLFSHRLVYEELTTDSKEPDLLSKCIKPLRNSFRTMQFDQAKLVSKIVSKFPGLIDSSREKDQADPWLVALGIEEQKRVDLFNPKKKVYIISEESESKPNRIPAVCKHYGIEHLNLERFYRLMGWSFQLSSK
jgi:hypothetical protein